MVVTAPNIVSMVSHWTDTKRHCMHLLATHYPSSSWPDRAAIYNRVCADNRTANQIRDEYGGHTAGRRNRQGGGKPTRSVRWNDEICRDEFGLPGPFDAQQQIDRGTILRDIQAAINTLGLSGNAGLGAVSLVAGMQLANVALANSNTGGVAPAAPAATASSSAAPLAGTATTAVSAQAGTSSTAVTAPATDAAANDGSDDDEGDDDESDDDGLVDPANGGAAWYHSWEIQRDGTRGRFVYRAIRGLPYDDDSPPPTFARRVRFPALGPQYVEVQVCAVGPCPVCGLKRFHSSSEEEDGGEEQDGG
jgi:hypothetical protein